MSNNRDDIRIDLLKFRRKAYLSYPENSYQRRNFLKMVLSNELRLAKEDIPQDFINFVIDGKKMVFWSAMKKAGPWLAYSLFCGIAFALLLSVKHNIFSFLLLPIGAICLAMGTQQLQTYWLYRKSIKAVEEYSNDMKKYMSRISNDIKKLDGPRGL